MRYSSYIVKAVGWGRLALFMALLLGFQILYVGIALLLSMLLDLVATSVATADPALILRFLIFALAYSGVLGVLVVACGRYKASLVRRVMTSLRSQVAHGLIYTEGKTTSRPRGTAHGT